MTDPGSEIVPVDDAAQQLVLRSTQPAPLPLDAHVQLLADYAEAQETERWWKARKEEIKAKLAALLGDTTVGTVNGTKAVTYEPVAQFNGSGFQKDFPDMWRLYQHSVAKQELDTARLKRERPDLYKQYQTRKMLVTYRAPGKS